MLLPEFMAELSEVERETSRRLRPSDELDPDHVIASALDELEWKFSGQHDSIPAPPPAAERLRQERPKRRRG